MIATVGMLWFDNDNSATLEIKVARASKYYFNKYGKKPNLCFVHPTALGKTNDDGSSPELTVDGVDVQPSRSVMINHLWLGQKDSQVFKAD